MDTVSARVRGAVLATLLGAGTWAGGAACAPPADTALADFDFVTAKVAANYSGWPTKTAGTRAAAIAEHTARMRARVADGGAPALRAAVDGWLAWFDDGHLRAQWNAAEASPPWGTPRGARGLHAALDATHGAGATPEAIEGTWTIDDRYRLEVVPRAGEAGMFEAVVQSTTADGWSPGDLKAVLAARQDGGFDVRYGTGDRKQARFTARLRAGGVVLDTGEFGLWRRVFTDPAAARAAARRWPGDAFELTRLDARTLYLRLPSFSDAHTATVRALIEANADALARTPHLVIDVRGNGGGSDFVYDPVLPLLYTRPIVKLAVEIRDSADNARLRREVAARLEANSPEAAATLRSESDRMDAGDGGFITREPAFSIVRFDAVRPMPSRVAVLVDGAGSSAESFLLDARQSRKVVLMGQEPSAGVLDFGETMQMPAPSGRFDLVWATTRSLRLPHDPVDPDGIAPDVRIPDDVRDPVAYAARWLASPTF